MDALIRRLRGENEWILSVGGHLGVLLLLAVGSSRPISLTVPTSPTAGLQKRETTVLLQADASRPTQTVSPRVSVHPEGAKPLPPSARAASVTGEGGANRVDTSAPSGSSVYLERLSREISRKQFYPRQARLRRQEGRVDVQFTIDHVGRVSAVRLQKSSSHETLNDAATELIASLSHVERPPADVALPLTVVVPVVYTLVGGTATSRIAKE
jgi:protein TonB